MFTGIVQDRAKIVAISHHLAHTHYGLKLPSPMLKNLVIGASICVHGICQTVTAIENEVVYFDAIQETLACTTVSSWQINDYVNVERSLKMGDEIGGHLLSGHIIGTGLITHIEKPALEQLILTIQIPAKWMKFIFPKGYVAINGVSLTVGKVVQNQFTVNLIPETCRITTFGQAYVGEKNPP